MMMSLLYQIKSVLFWKQENTSSFYIHVKRMSFGGFNLLLCLQTSLCSPTLTSQDVVLSCPFSLFSLLLLCFYCFCFCFFVYGLFLLMLLFHMVPWRWFLLFCFYVGFCFSLLSWVFWGNCWNGPWFVGPYLKILVLDQIELYEFC